MNNNNSTKSWRTTLVGIIGLIFLLVIGVLVYLDKATLNEATAAMAPAGILLGVIGNWMSKDANVTHSGRSTNIIVEGPDPKKEEK